MLNCCFLIPKIHISLRGTTSFNVFRVKMGSGIVALTTLAWCECLPMDAGQSCIGR